MLRFANFAVHPTEPTLLVSILEDHKYCEPSDVVNTLCVINTTTKCVFPLVSGADFYASPKFSPDGTRIAWQQWCHPYMPWEGAKIFVANVVIRKDRQTITLKDSFTLRGRTGKSAYPTPSGHLTRPFCLLVTNSVTNQVTNQGTKTHGNILHPREQKPCLC